MSRAEVTTWNFSEIRDKRKFIEHVNTLKGLHDVSIKPRKLTRSLNQNSFYWAAYVTPFAHYLRAEWGDPSITLEQAHDVLKRALLPVRTKVIKETGEVMELTPSTRLLDTLEFSIYLDAAKEFLGRNCCIDVLDSDLFWESKDQLRRGKAA